MCGIVGIVGIVLFFLAKDKDLDPAWFIPGAAVTVFGEWLRLWAAGHLRKNKQLTTTGPYSYVKNPLYIGTLLITIGYSAMAQNIYILIGGFVWFFIYYAPYKKKQENEKLVGSFGEGADVLLFRVTDAIAQTRAGARLQEWIETGAALPSYEKYLKYRRIVESDEPTEAISNVNGEARQLRMIMLLNGLHAYALTYFGPVGGTAQQRFQSMVDSFEFVR